MLLGVALVRYAPPDVVPSSAPVDVFSGERARQFQAGLVADGATRAIGAPGHARAERWLEDALRTLGWTVSTQAAVACANHGVCARTTNVVATLAGQDPTQGAILVSAHYDSVGAGPGASDDGFGTATLLETARALVEGPRPRRTMILLFTDGEEAGLLGALAFVRENPLAAQVRATINIDSRGGRGPSQMFQTSAGNAALVRLIVAHLPRPVTTSLYYEIYKRMPNGTDFDVFKRLAPGVDFANTSGIENYHSSLDTIANSDVRTLQHDGDHVLAMARGMSTGVPGSFGGTDAVWFDVLAFGIVSWPGEWSTILALIAFALLVGQTVRLRELGIGLVAFGLVPLGLVAALGLGWVLGHGALPAPFVAHPAFALGALHLVTAAVVVFFRRHLGIREQTIWAGVWLGWAAVGLALAAKMPGASYLFVVPAFAAALLGLVRVRIGFAWACAVPAVLAAVLAVALLPGLHEALGFAVTPMLVLPTALLASTILPMLGTSWRPAATLASGSVVLAAVAFTVPAYSVERPQRVNVVLRQNDKDTRVALDTSWGASRELAPPAPMRDALASLTTSGSIPKLDLALPTVEVLSAEDRDGKHIARVRIQTHRDATAFTLRFAGDRRREVKVEGRFAFLRANSLSLLASPDAPLTLTIEATGPGPVTATLSDRTYGLPAGSAAEAIALTRPTTAVPTQDGDVTTVTANVSF